MTTLKTWTNPRNGEERIYVNDWDLFSGPYTGAKAFFTKVSLPSRDMAVLSVTGDSSTRDLLESQICEALEGLGADPGDWESLLKATK